VSAALRDGAASHKTNCPSSPTGIINNMDEQAFLARITIRTEQCGGRPCIRGMRIRVADILDLLAHGLTTQEVVAELPDLEAADVQAALLYARRLSDHPILAA
jgi:uncharacterized protein (DUF433 family)